MKLVDLRDLLLSTGIPCFHYSSRKATGNYIVWAEEGQGDNSTYGDDRLIIQDIQGTIKYYTKTEFDPKFDLIQEKLNSADIAWELDDISYNEETEYIEYTWKWSMGNNLDQGMHTGG